MRMTERCEIDSIAVMLHDSSTSERAMELIVERYSERLYWHIRRIVFDHDDTEDALQETFVSAFLNSSGFRSDTESSLKCWLYKIATSKALKLLKRRKRALFESVESIQYRLASDIDSENQVSGDEICARLQKAVLGLPLKQREVFNLRYYDELSYDEISEITGSSVTTLKTNYHYAVEKVKEKVNTIDYEE